MSCSDTGRSKHSRIHLVRRSIALLSAEFAFNVVLWIVAACLFAPDKDKRRVLSLCVIAWTLGLRHGLDVDHISAIDNATRHLIGLNQMPTTVGMFFSFGHSTIVLVVVTAVAISVNVANHIDGVGGVGGVIGVSVSASFLLLIAIINSFVLFKTLKARQEVQNSVVSPSSPLNIFPASSIQGGYMMKVFSSIFKVINRPWKMYPVGILFGLGFDTASEVTLLGVSALARRDDTTGSPIAASNIVILPLLFTAGMSLVDSLDAVGMVFAYGIPFLDDGVEEWWRLWMRASKGSVSAVVDEGEKDIKEEEEEIGKPDANPNQEGMSVCCVEENKASTFGAKKSNTFFKLSVMLTIMSIIIALLISIIEFMGLAAEKCASCARDAEEDNGLSGRWWRFWIAVNDNSGYIGAAVAGTFLVVTISWLLFAKVRKRARKIEAKEGRCQESAV
ncbi:NicO-domain-containing protein [Atractiella rhizophila]|nr:NicO-domain-containing protein [Atractiella rhizophila]